MAFSSASAGDTGQETISPVDTKVAKPVQQVPQAQPIQPEAESRPASGSITASKRASVQFSTTGVSSMSSLSSSLAGMVSESLAGVTSSAGLPSSAAGSLAPPIKYTVLYDFTAGDPTELTVHEGNIVMAATSSTVASPGWVMVELDREKGWVPENYLKVVEEEEEVVPVSSVTEDHREEKGWWLPYVVHPQNLEHISVG